MYMCILHMYTCIEIGKEKDRQRDRDRGCFILRNWLTQLWRLASLKYAGQAGRQETRR